MVLGGDAGKERGDGATARLPDRFSRSTDLLTTVIDGDIVALSLSRDSYFGMSGTGTRVWELLETPRSIDELVTLICSEFVVDEATARADIIAFVSELHQNRLLEPAV